jgi:hypothetical protein
MSSRPAKGPNHPEALSLVVKLVEREAGILPLSSAEVKITCIYISIHPYVFVA